MCARGIWKNFCARWQQVLISLRLCRPLFIKGQDGQIKYITKSADHSPAPDTKEPDFLKHKRGKKSSSPYSLIHIFIVDASSMKLKY